MDKLFKRNSGFTLIEIIVVIVIMGIIAIVAIPQFNGTIQSKRLFDAVEKVNDDLNLGRDYAIAQHTNVWILFEPNQDRYRMFYGQDWGSRNRFRNHGNNSPEEWFTVSDMFLGVEIRSTSFSRNRLEFNWWGTPSEGGNIVLINGSKSHTITVQPETGYVQR